MSDWGFSNAIAFAVAMTIRDMSEEREKKRIKTQKFYQECYEKITDDSAQAFDVVTKVVKKASRRYIPEEIGIGSTYLALYAFAIVIKRQGKVTKEQSKIIKIYFNNMNYPFTESSYIEAAKRGTDVGNFRSIIAIDFCYAGIFWVDFFRALYKSGTQKDLQDVIDYITSIIIRFSFLGNPNSDISNDICQNFIDCINFQINQVREITNDEIDWLGIVPIKERLEEMKITYENLIDESNITNDISKDELLPLLELEILNCICDVVMLTKRPKSIKLEMMNDAFRLTGIHTEVTPEQYVKEIANNTPTGQFYKKIFSSFYPLGTFWNVLFSMGTQLSDINSKNNPVSIVNNILSILLQIESYLDEKYNFLGEESIAKNYIYHILKQISENFDREE